MTPDCDYCPNPAKYRAKAVIGPPIFVCESCNDLGDMYEVKEIEE